MSNFKAEKSGSEDSHCEKGRYSNLLLVDMLCLDRKVGMNNKSEENIVLNSKNKDESVSKRLLQCTVEIKKEVMSLFWWTVGKDKHF